MERVFVSGNHDIFHKIINSCLKLETTPAVLDGNIITWINVLRFIYNQKYIGSDLCARNILINYLYNANQAVPGSELWFLKFLKDDYKLKKVKRISSNEAMERSKKLLRSERAINIFKNIPILLGSTGKIIVSTDKNPEDTLKLTSGCSVEMRVDHRFISQITTSDITIDHCSVLIIEGAPASVAEINKLLAHCFESRTNLILLARSFPDEVISTLSVNWLKNKLTIVPMVYGTELNNINSHADLAAISGATPISKMLGDTMQTDFKEKFGTLQNVSITESGILCSPQCSPKNLIRDLLDRIKKISNAENEKAALLYRRVSGLSGECLNIYLKESRDIDIIKEELDTIIPYYSYMCYSAAEVEMNGQIEILPYQVYKQADQMRKEFIQYVNSIGGYLVSPNN